MMLVGYGIKDSCYEIAELQFRDIQMYDGSVYLKEDISDEIRTESPGLYEGRFGHQSLYADQHEECNTCQWKEINVMLIRSYFRNRKT